MIIGKVIGNVWATRKTECLSGKKLLLIQPLCIIKTDRKVQRPFVAVDVIGAGIGEMVLCAFGHAASMNAGEKNLLVDAAVTGILDGVEIVEPEEDQC